MEAVKGIDISKKSSVAYASFQRMDFKKYLYYLKDWAGTGERYHTIYKSSKDIKVPTREVVEKVFYELYNNDPTYQKQLKKLYTALILNSLD